MKLAQELIEQLDNNNLYQEETINTLSKMDVGNCILAHLKVEKREFVIANLLRVIGKIGDRKSVPLLLEYYKNSNSNIVRMASIYALEELDDYSVVPIVLKALKDEKVDNVREQMISLIAELTTKQPIEMLIENLQADDSFVREAAAGAIYYICKRPVDILLNNLEEATTSDQKVELIDVLRMIKSRRAIPLLQSMLNDEEKAVRITVEFALKEIEDGYSNDG